ncbi:MAG: RNA ligase family protein [Myxococcaceae bacterium]|nr:RNA ligase family protein [Myxococcaceae bacterium]
MTEPSVPKKKKDLPLGKKAYHRIPHLPGSRTGSSDRMADPPLARRCIEQARQGDTIVVQEKLDGSCVALARIGDALVALGREGWRAAESDNPGRRMFAAWANTLDPEVHALLDDGDRLVGEWLALAHSTRYVLTHAPFVAFDWFHAGRWATSEQLTERFGRLLTVPHVVHRGGAIGIADAVARLGEQGRHGATDAVEGLVWRVERDGETAAWAKYVRPGKRDGALLPENTGEPAVWNWRLNPQ